MFGFAMVVMGCRVRIEVAHAEVWTAAGLNRSSVHRPVGRRGGRVTGGHAQQGNHAEKNDFAHQSPSWREIIYQECGLSNTKQFSDFSRCAWALKVGALNLPGPARCSKRFFRKSAA